MPGETSLILVGVHGDERCGIEALKKILPNWKIEYGTVLIEFGNPHAIDANVRYTEANLNRMFKSDELLADREKESYEYQRAQYLKTLMQKAEVLLDVHASFTPESQPFVICESNALSIVSRLPFDTVVSGFDAVEPGGTDYYMNSIGKIGIAIECGYLGDPASTDRAIEAILGFLRARGHVSGDMAQVQQSHIRLHQLYLTETDNFKLSRPFADFEQVAEGEIIGRDGDKGIAAIANSVILFARDRAAVGEEAFLLGSKTTVEQF